MKLIFVHTKAVVLYTRQEVARESKAGKWASFQASASPALRQEPAEIAALAASELRLGALARAHA